MVSESLFSKLETDAQEAADLAYRAVSKGYGVPVDLIFRQAGFCFSVSKDMVETLHKMNRNAYLLEANGRGHFNVELEALFLTDATWQQFLGLNPSDPSPALAPKVLIGLRSEIPVILRRFSTPDYAISLITKTHIFR